MEWYHSKNILKKSPKLSPTYDEQSASLTIKKIVDNDAGEYTVKVFNDYGTAEVSISVVIMRKKIERKFSIRTKYIIFFLFLGRPSPPGCPEAIDATDNSLTLFWKLPEDDGNSNITEYILEYQEKTQKK